MLKKFRQSINKLECEKGVSRYSIKTTKSLKHNIWVKDNLL